MKKILILGFISIFLLVGCGKFDSEEAIKEFKDNVSSSKSYEIKGNMEIISDEDVFNYDLTVEFKEEDYYKVNLMNKVNNHEQIILKNDDGVYVVTPSLNKSFKFQSEWPNNSSQAYLLQSLLNDLDNTKEVELIEEDDTYILVAAVNYPNNPDLVQEKIYFDEDMNLQKVEVLNESDIVKIRVVFESINYKASFDEENFNLDKLIDENCMNNPETCKPEENKQKTTEEETETEEQTNKVLEDIVYPLYVPVNTYLTNKDTVDIPNGERVILTFGGEKNFILVEETIDIPDELEVIPVYGDPLMLNDTIAALSGNSLHWNSLNTNYYLTGDDLSTEELLTIATSLAVNTAVETNMIGK